MLHISDCRAHYFNVDIVIVALAPMIGARRASVD